MNKVFLVGNLGRAPEEGGKGEVKIAKFSVATSRRVKRGDVWEDETDWHNAVAFGKTAENCLRFLDKGSKVCVEGQLRTRSWLKEGEATKRYATEVVVDRVEFLSRKSGGEGEGEGGGEGSGWGAKHHETRIPAPASPSSDSNFDDDVPF